MAVAGRLWLRICIAATLATQNLPRTALICGEGGLGVGGCVQAASSKNIESDVVYICVEDL